MRWNCPHCEELVTAGIDFENTKKAYVRCAKCNGMALVHRSAVLADYVKARRMEEEAQLEAELRLAQTAAANTRIQSMESQMRGLNERLAVERATNERLVAVQSAAAGQLASLPRGMPPLPNAAMMEAGMETVIEAPRAPIPPPFRPSYDDLEEGSMQSDIAAAPPTFAYAKPPAFLLKPSAIETIERSFATDEEGLPIEPMIATPAEAFAAGATIGEGAIGIAEAIPSVAPADAATEPKGTSIRATVAVWIAAAIAIASGLYLYQEGKRAFAPAAPTEADEIRSKANSAVRTESRTLVIVRVPRAILRDGPSIEAASIQTIDMSSVATVVEEKDGWMKVESPKIGTADRTAWIRGDLVARMPN